MRPIGLLLLLAALSSPVLGQEVTDVAVVGGGIGGLTAAYNLQKMNALDFKVYEADARLGGRIRSEVNNFGTGLVTNAGAELVDSTHTDLLALLKELGVEVMERASPSDLAGGEFLLGTERLGADEVMERIRRESPTALDALRRDSVAYEREFAAGGGGPLIEKLDATSIDAYLTKIGAGPTLRKFVETIATSETGAPTTEVSGVLVFELVKVAASGQEIELLPHNDEKFRIVGGTEKVIEKLAAKVQDHAALEHKLESVSKVEGGYELRFATPEGPRTVTAKSVVFALPAHVMRNVPMPLPDMPETTRRAIKELQYGGNAKVTLYFSDRVWRKHGHNGGFISDVGCQVWDSSQGQAAKAGSLTFYFRNADATPERIEAVKQQLEKALPGLKGAYLGHKVYNWKASYTSFGVGQVTDLPRFEAFGDVHFAGEHVSELHRGYMNGAVETAKAAVKRVASSAGRGAPCKGLGVRYAAAAAGL